MNLSVLCFRKIPIAKKFMDKKGGGRGSIKIFRRKFFVSQCRKYSQVNSSVLCFRKFPVAKKFMYKKGGVSRFSVEIFCLTAPKISVGESFTVALFSDSEKDYGEDGGREYQDFTSKIFCLTVPKKFVGESFSNSMNSGIESC